MSNALVSGDIVLIFLRAESKAFVLLYACNTSTNTKHPIFC